MNPRRLALVNVGSDASQAFRSMLEVLKGRTRSAWYLVAELELADVVVSENDKFSSTHDVQSTAKPLIAIVNAGKSGARPKTPYVLTHPFRVMQVLGVLDEISDAGECFAVPFDKNQPTQRWVFAESVRALGAAQSQVAWYRTHTDHGGEIIVTGNLHSFACDASVFEQVCSGTAVLSALNAADVRNVPSHYQRRPLFELLWNNGLRADAMLAPWLDARGQFHIRRWPDFGTLACTRQQLQMTALLTKRSWSRAQLAETAHVPLAEVDRLLNALSLCDLLVLDTSPEHLRNKSVTPLPGFMRALIGSLRRSLKLAY